MKKLRIPASLLLLLCFLLPACGQRGPSPGTSPAPNGSPVPAEARYLRYDVTEDRSFELSYVDHDFGQTELVLLGEEKKGSRLLRVPFSGDEVTELHLDKAYRQVAAGADCLWLGEGMNLCRLDLSGQETLSLSLPEKIEDLLWDESGRLYAAHRNSLTVISETGETESIPLPQDYTGGSLLRLGSGAIGVYASRVKGDTAALQRIDGSSLAPVDTGEASIGVLASGNASADFYYVKWTYSKELSEAEQVFRFSEGRSAPVFDLSGADREGKILGLSPQGGDFLLLYGGEEGAGLLRFTPTEAEKKVLTVGRLNNNHFVTDLIARYNREHPEYYLVNRHYYGESVEEQLEQLELDILAGDRPDILDTMEVNVEVYGAKGLLRNLYSMIDADPTIGREDFVPSVLRALETKSGALYLLWPQFTLWTSAEPAIFVGDRESWTMEDLYRICEEDPELTLYGNFGNQRVLFDFTLTGVMGHFADFESGELHFDTPEFVEYLNFMLDMYHRAADYTGGEFLLYMSHFNSVGDFARGIKDAEERGLQFTGFPCYGGTGHRCAGEISFAILEGTGNEEDAWAFFRWFLSEEMQEEMERLPMRRSVLEARLEVLEYGTPETTVTRFVDPEAAALGENAETVTYTLPAVPGLTEEEFATVRRMLDGIEGIYDDTMVNPCYFVVLEEYSNLYKGAKTAEETARSIQDRLSIYVAERSP